jgi:hypothetical protein
MRALFEIARDIEAHVTPLPASAVPYVKWLRYLEGVDDGVGETTGQIILRNLKVHLRGCTGAATEALKAELEAIADSKGQEGGAIQGSGQFISQPAGLCQLCGMDLADHGKLVIGETVSGRTAAIMCTACHMFLGVGFGTDVGRLYSRRSDGRWEQLPVSECIFTKSVKARIGAAPSAPALAPWMGPQERHPVLDLIPVALHKAVVRLFRRIGFMQFVLDHAPVPLRKAVGRLLERIGFKRLVVRNFFRGN